MQEVVLELADGRTFDRDTLVKIFWYIEWEKRVAAARMQQLEIISGGLDDVFKLLEEDIPDDEKLKKMHIRMHTTKASIASNSAEITAIRTKYDEDQPKYFEENTKLETELLLESVKYNKMIEQAEADITAQSLCKCFNCSEKK